MGMERARSITQNTLIPLGLVITLVASAMSYAKLESKVEEHEKAIKKVARIERLLYRVAVKMNVSTESLDGAREE